MKQTNNNNRISSFIAGALCYIGIDKYSDDEQIIFQNGAMYGYEYAILQIMDLAPSCEVVPLRNNETIGNLINTDCLDK